MMSSSGGRRISSHLDLEDPRKRRKTIVVFDLENEISLRRTDKIKEKIKTLNHSNTLGKEQDDSSSKQSREGKPATIGTSESDHRRESLRFGLKLSALKSAPAPKKAARQRESIASRTSTELDIAGGISEVNDTDQEDTSGTGSSNTTLSENGLLEEITAGSKNVETFLTYLEEG